MNGNPLDAFSSMLTPPGQNAALGSSATQGQAQSSSAGLLQQLAPLIQQQIANGASLEPQRQSTLQSLMSLMNPQTGMANVGALRAGAADQAMRAGRGATAQFGADSSLGKSAQVGAFNSGVSTSNKALGNVYDPGQQANLYSSMLGTISGAQNPSAMGSYGQLLQGVYGRPAVQVGQGAAGVLGQLGGDYMKSQAGG